MAGEIEEPFSFNFQVDSVHSGSISFGRFESEALCWERRSLFSHNRYLEEVERCSKPGSVTEKKALFEAHFRKKGFLGLNSPGCLNEAELQSRKSDVPGEMSNDEEIGLMNDASCCASFDESKVFGTSFPGPQIERAGVTTNNVDHVPEHVKTVEADDAEIRSLISANSKLEVEMKDSVDGESANMDENLVSDMFIDKFHDNHINRENTNPSPKAHLQGSSPKGRTPSEAECMKPRTTPRNRVEERRKYTSSSVSKVSEKKVSKTFAVRSKEEKTSETPKRHPTHETSKYKPGARTKGVDHFNSAHKASTSRGITGPKLHQSAIRVSPAVGANNPRLRENNSRFSVKSDERAQRRKEVDMKLEGKMHAQEAKMHQFQKITQERKTAEIKQSGKSLQFKAKPVPSFYRGTLREPDGIKAVTPDCKPQKLPSEVSNSRIGVATGTRSSYKGGTEQAISRCTSTRTTTDQPQVSATSCHSTVTSDSCTSYPAGARNRHTSRAGQCLVSKKKEVPWEKPTFSQKNKVPDGNQMHKGKTVDGRQKEEVEKVKPTNSRKNKVAEGNQMHKGKTFDGRPLE